MQMRQTTTARVSATEAKLENGDIVRYGLCSANRNCDLAGDRTYLGKGIIYSVNGVRQSRLDEVLHFWARKGLITEKRRREPIGEVEQ